MKEIYVNAKDIADILAGSKTIEGLLGEPDNLKIKSGDVVAFKADPKQIGGSDPVLATIKVTQVLYFESFEEMLTSLNYKVVVPRAKSTEAALATYRKLYTADDEYEYGVVALIFDLQETT